MLVQLNPPIPVETPDGPALAHGWLDYGAEYQILWIVFRDGDGVCWTYPNADIRGVKNLTMARRELLPFPERERDPYNNDWVPWGKPLPSDPRGRPPKEAFEKFGPDRSSDDEAARVDLLAMRGDLFYSTVIKILRGHEILSFERVRDVDRDRLAVTFCKDGRQLTVTVYGREILTNDGPAVERLARARTLNALAPATLKGSIPGGGEVP